MEKQKILLYLSSLIRIISTVVILYFVNIPLFYKILIIIAIDRIDCMPTYYPHRGPLFSRNKTICKTILYQKIDKITDIICYFFILIYLANYKIFNIYSLLIMLFFFMLRLVGVILFFNSDNRNYLLYFPDFFIVFCMCLITVSYFKISQKYTIPILIVIFLLKIYQEKIMHYT